MDKVRILSCLVVAFVVISSVSLAEAKKKITKRPTPTTEIPQVVQRFGALSLKGELKKPELKFDQEKLGFEQDSKLQIPENFNHEILEGVSSL